MNKLRINGWMKVVLALIAFHFSFLTVDAQPKARRAQAAAAKKQQNSQGQLTRRAQLMFPTAIAIVCDGSSFSQRQKDTFRRLARNRRFYISRVKAIGPDGIERQLPTSMEVIIK